MYVAMSAAIRDANSMPYGVAVAIQQDDFRERQSYTLTLRTHEGTVSIRDLRWTDIAELKDTLAVQLDAELRGAVESFESDDDS